MKKHKANELVRRCAEIASVAPLIKSYVIIYTTTDNDFRRCSGGDTLIDLALVDIARVRMMDEYRDAPSGRTQQIED